MAARLDPADVVHLSSTTTKRALRVASHAMEVAFQDVSTDRGPAADVGELGDADGDVGLVIGFFQRREYFDVEASRYAAMADVGHTVIVAFNGSIEGLPTGVTAVSLADDDPERGSWVLTMVRGAFAATLSARDIQQLSAYATTLEASRMFVSWTTLQRDVAVQETMARLEYLAARLPAQVLVRARAQIGRTSVMPVSAGEARLARAADDLLRAVEAGHQRATSLRSQLESSQSRAERDHLTGLHNRYFLERYLGSGGRPAELMALLIDVDDLKQVNDRFGHEAGDALLRCVADTMRANSRPGDVLVRWGGDEFLVLVPHIDTAAGLRHGQRLAAAIASRCLVAPWHELKVSASIGVSPIRDTSLPMAGLDAALSQVKRTHKGRAAADPRGSHMPERPEGAR